MAVTRKERPQLGKISEEMREWAALLGQELASWPAVTVRRMFGMMAFYRRGLIFAALPRTRTFTAPNQVAFKLRHASPGATRLLRNDPRIANAPFRKAGWISFTIRDGRDLAGALEWFARAYASCAPQKTRRRRRA